MTFFKGFKAKLAAIIALIAVSVTSAAAQFSSTQNTAVGGVVSGGTSGEGLFIGPSSTLQMQGDLLSLYDDFSRYANNTVMSGQSPYLGPNWQTSGSQLPTISNGQAVSSGTGYLFNVLSSAPYMIGADVSFSGGTDLTQMPIAIAMSPDSTLTLNNLLHFNFGPTGFDLSIRQNGGAFFTISSANWLFPMNNTGTIYRVKMAVKGYSVTIFGPNGEVYGISDVRVPAVTGKTVFWEPNVSSGLQAAVSRAWAVTRNTANPISVLPTIDDQASLGGLFKASRVAQPIGRMSETSIGNSTSAPPIIQLGPDFISTQTLTATLSGATSIEVPDYIPSGTSIVIDPGPNQETVTTSGVSFGSGYGIGPYTLTVPALSFAHGINASVYASNSALSGLGINYQILYNQVSGAIQLPFQVSVGGSFLFYSGGPCGQALYLDGSFSTCLSGNGSGIVSIGPNTSTSGTASNSSHISIGTSPVGTTGSCSASSFTGGATAGKFTAPSCAGGTIILSALPAAPNGYTCNAQDQTTSADTLKQTANTTTSATFTATTAASDVVVFQCTGW
jgi:hypothetical protein